MFLNSIVSRALRRFWQLISVLYVLERQLAATKFTFVFLRAAIRRMRRALFILEQRDPYYDFPTWKKFAE